MATETLTLENAKRINEEETPVMEYIEVPKVLGDLVESLMGAIYLDSGLDMNAVWRSFNVLFPNMDAVIKEYLFL